MISTLVALCIAAIIAWLLPTRYESSVVIRMERTELPRGSAQQDMAAFAEERIRAISHRVITQEKLLGLIDRFGLYADVKGRMSPGELEALMRDDIRIAIEGKEIEAPTQEQAGNAAIVFSVTYSGESKEIARNVADALAAFFLEDDIRIRERHWDAAREALDAALSDIREKVVVAEEKVIQFRIDNLELMPEHAIANLQALEDMDHRIEQAMEDERILRDREYNLREKLDTLPQTNPLYGPLEKSLAAVRSKLNAMARVIQGLNKKSIALRRRIDDAPIVEREYKALVTQRDALQAEYFRLLSKLEEESAAFEQEKSRRGERYEIVKAAQFPKRPASPNIPAILLAGLAAGLLAGVAFTSWRYSRDGALRSLEHVAAALPYPALAAIPVLKAPGEASGRSIGRFLLTGAIVSMIVCLIVYGILLWPR